MATVFKKCYWLILAVLSFSGAGVTHAAFELNFTPVQNPTNPADFPRGGYSNSGNPFACPDSANPDCLTGDQASNDPTSFYYERVDGYWHMIVGDPAQGFAQETYTPMVSLFWSNSGGHEPVLFILSGNVEQWSGNGWDPLGINHKTYGPENTSFTGNATGDPRFVVVRQVLGEGELSGTTDLIQDWTCDVAQFCQEFIKSELGFKPIITQDYDDGIVAMEFSLDMSSISYDDMATAGVMTNIISIQIADLPSEATAINAPSSTYFDMATDSQHSVVTGGRYIYTPGSGWHDDGDGDRFYAWGAGSYQYVDIGVDNFHLDIDWSSYLDPAQNPVGAYPGNESRCADMALSACNNTPVAY